MPVNSIVDCQSVSAVCMVCLCVCELHWKFIERFCIYMDIWIRVVAHLANLIQILLHKQRTTYNACMKPYYRSPSIPGRQIRQKNSRRSVSILTFHFPFSIDFQIEYKRT